MRASLYPEGLIPSFVSCSNSKGEGKGEGELQLKGGRGHTFFHVLPPFFIIPHSAFHSSNISIPQVGLRLFSSRFPRHYRLI